MAKKPATSGRRVGPTFLDVAAVVLSRVKRPLPSKEIIAKTREWGLLRSFGKTPDHTLTAALYLDIAQGSKSRFSRLAKPGPSRAVRNTVRWTLRS